MVNTPELVRHGQRIRIVEATLSCDEESPVRIARVEIAAITDFAAIGIGNTINLGLGLETFLLVVDGNTLSRTSVADQRMQLTAVSPVALLDAPFAGTIHHYEAGAVPHRSGGVPDQPGGLESSELDHSGRPIDAGWRDAALGRPRHRRGHRRHRREQPGRHGGLPPPSPGQYPAVRASRRAQVATVRV